jgi:hypothetical protein
MIDFLIKAAIIVFLIVPLIVCCIAFVVMAEYLTMQEKNKGVQENEKV